MKNIAVPALAALLLISMVSNFYLFRQASKLHTNVAALENTMTTINGEAVALKAELETATAEQTATLATLKALEDEMDDLKSAAITQEDFDLQYGAELTAVAMNTDLSVADRTTTITEIGDLFHCNVGKYLAMINTGSDFSTSTTTTPATEPEVSTTPPTTAPTPPPTDTPGAVPNTDKGTGGTSTEGLTDDEIDNLPKGGFGGKATPGSGGNRTNPGNESGLS